MSEVTKIKIDGGSLIKYANGRVTIGGRGSCLSWGLLITIGVSTLGAFALMVSEMFRNLLNATYILGISVFLGFGTWFIYNNIKRGMIVLDPSTKSIRRRKHEIPFSEVESVSTSTSELPMMEGAVLVTFYANLFSSEKFVIGSISGDDRKIFSRVDQFQTIIDQTING